MTRGEPGRLRATPVATSPAASPAKVPSTMRGKTLLVPVETGTSGTSPQPLATARLVPSPPSVMIAADAEVAQALGGLGRIAGVGDDGHLEGRQRQPRFGRRGSALDDAVGIGKIGDLGNARGRETEQGAADDVDLLVVVERRAVRHQAPDVLPRGRVGDDADE